VSGVDEGNLNTEEIAMLSFGQRLRLLRGNRPQKDVARALKIPPTTLSTLENQESVPRGEVVQRLARHFGVPVTYFYPQQSQPARVSERAKGFLRSIRENPVQGRDTIATHAAPDEGLELDDETKELIAEKIGQLAKTQEEP
jgi:transcriptional regulator with XRE-family HTH domain